MGQRRRRGQEFDPNAYHDEPFATSYGKAFNSMNVSMERTQEENGRVINKKKEL